MNKLVSIIVPAYNAGSFIKETLESAINQDYVPIEIIVIDDGSTDDTVNVVKSFGDSVTLIQNNHQGSAIARNTGIKISNGDYLVFLDADDLLTASSIKSRINALENNPDIQLAFGHQQYFYDDHMDNTLRKNLEAQYGDKTVPAEIISTLMLSRNDFLKIGYFEVNQNLHDFLGWYGSARDYGFKPMVVDDVVIKRRIHNNNLSRNQGNQTLASSLKHLLDQRRQQANDQI